MSELTTVETVILAAVSDRPRYGPKPPTRAARARPDCPPCRGTGLRLRIGRRLANRARRAHRNATR